MLRYFQNGLFIGSVAFCFFILFAGYVALFSHMPGILHAVSYLSYFRYAFEGLMITIYGYDRGPLVCPAPHTYCHYRYPQRIFEELSMNERNFSADIFMLMFFVVFFFSFGYMGLKRRVRTSWSGWYCQKPSWLRCLGNSSRSRFISQWREYWWKTGCECELKESCMRPHWKELY